MVSRVSVTLAMALTTTTGFCARRPSTMEATQSMALASSTEVPPNFMTIMGGTSLGGWVEVLQRLEPSRKSAVFSQRLKRYATQNLSLVLNQSCAHNPGLALKLPVAFR